MPKKSKNVEKKEDVNFNNEDIIKEICKNVEEAEIVSEVIGYVSTGNFAIDHACSGKFWNGGLPLGRITEMYGSSSSGKTAIGIHLLQGVQQQGGIGVLIDSEAAYTSAFGDVLGLDNNRLIYLQPECLEDCFTRIYDIVSLIRSKSNDMRPIVIVYDSIAASPSRREIEKLSKREDLGSSMGHRALICSDYLRNIAGFLKKEKAAVVVINQVREKIGVMFGCFNYDARVVLEDGTTEKIGKIVNNKMDVKVRSLNPKTGKIESKKIINWFNNGKADKFLQFTIEKPYGNGKSQFGVTENHIIFTPDGEIPAGNLNVGDQVLSQVEFKFSDLQRKIAIGSILGDGSIKKSNKNGGTYLTIGHGKKQVEYCQWKESLFDNMNTSSCYDDRYGYHFSTPSTFDLSSLRELTYEYENKTKVKRKKITQELVDEIDLMSLAIWYLDDGSFSGSYKKWGNGKSVIYCPVYDGEELNMLADKIEELGIPRPSIKEGKGLRFNSGATNIFHSKISKFVHPSMDYKLHPKYRNKFNSKLFENRHIEPWFEARPMKIVDIKEKLRTRSMNKFDLEIEDNHTYLVDGVCVHNSPETTAGGGRSLEFYCSVRLNCCGRGRILDKRKQALGIKMDVINVKNKVAKPFRSARGLELFFDKGISPTSGLLDILVEEEKIEQAGGWYKLPGADKGFRASNFVDVLLENPNLVDAPDRQAVEKFLGVNKESLELSISNSENEVEDENVDE